MIDIEKIVVKVDNMVVIDKLSLEIGKGDKVLIKAPSGKGKTTFFRALLGFVPLESGEIKIDGLDLCEKNMRKIRDKISYISQGVELPSGNVKDVVKEIFNYKRNRDRELNTEEAKKKFVEFGLDKNIFEKQMENLSGGERQRLAIIILVLLDRDIWLLDEVTASLDLELKLLIERYILESDKTVLLISHDTHWHTENFKEVTW